MDAIITVNENEQTVSARDLYAAVGSTERFNSWFDRQLQFGFVEGEDFTSVKSFTLVNNGAKREVDDFALTVDMAKQICMVQKTDKAREVRQYLIDLEKAWNTPEQILARALRVAEQTIANTQKQIEAMKPKADFYDSVADSKTAIQIGDVAKMLGVKGIGRNNLFQLLRDKKILDHNNVPYQQYVDCGYFRVIEQKYTVAGEVRINIKTLVYQKGIDWIRRITEHEAIPKLEVE